MSTVTWIIFWHVWIGASTVIAFMMGCSPAAMTTPRWQRIVTCLWVGLISAIAMSCIVALVLRRWV